MKNALNNPTKMTHLVSFKPSTLKKKKKNRKTYTHAHTHMRAQIFYLLALEKPYFGERVHKKELGFKTFEVPQHST